MALGLNNRVLVFGLIVGVVGLSVIIICPRDIVFYYLVFVVCACHVNENFCFRGAGGAFNNRQKPATPNRVNFRCKVKAAFVFVFREIKRCCLHYRYPARRFACILNLRLRKLCSSG